MIFLKISSLTLSLINKKKDNFTAGKALFFYVTMSDLKKNLKITSNNYFKYNILSNY